MTKTTRTVLLLASLAATAAALALPYSCMVLGATNMNTGARGAFIRPFTCWEFHNLPFRMSGGILVLMTLATAVCCLIANLSGDGSIAKGWRRLYIAASLSKLSSLSSRLLQ